MHQNYLDDLLKSNEFAEAQKSIFLTNMYSLGDSLTKFKFEKLLYRDSQGNREVSYSSSTMRKSIDWYQEAEIHLIYPTSKISGSCPTTT